MLSPQTHQASAASAVPRYSVPNQHWDVSYSIPPRLCNYLNINSDSPASISNSSTPLDSCPEVTYFSKSLSHLFLMVKNHTAFSKVPRDVLIARSQSTACPLGASTPSAPGFLPSSPAFLNVSLPCPPLHPLSWFPFKCHLHSIYLFL